jgi:hypothetical protein
MSAHRSPPGTSSAHRINGKLPIRPGNCPARSPTVAHPRAAPAQRADQQDQPARDGITARRPGRARPGAAPVPRPGPLGQSWPYGSTFAIMPRVLPRLGG